MKTLKLLNKAKAAVYTATLSFFCSAQAFADGMPTAPKSDSDSGKEGLTGIATNYFMDGLILLLLGMASWGFSRVAQNILTTYGEISDGKATYKDLGGSVIAGVVILSIVIYLLVEAAAIFGIDV